MALCKFLTAIALALFASAKPLTASERCTWAGDAGTPPDAMPTPTEPTLSVEPVRVPEATELEDAG